MIRLDLRRTLQVGDGAAQLEDAVEGAAAHALMITSSRKPALQELVSLLRCCQISLTQRTA
jgi:hypothetical protein